MTKVLMLTHLAEAIQYLLENKDVRGKMGKNGRKLKIIHGRG